MAQNNSTLYLLSYANYFNRIVKREDTVDAYIPYKVYEPLVCNFNPADGIDTEHIFNFPYLANTPTADYCVVADETNTITSRWFIVNANRMRGGQYRLTLHRDLIADYYDEVMSAPCYIQRATTSTGSPLIFNSEKMTFNQIKKREVELTDETNCRWIVGYCATNAFDPYTPTQGGEEVRPGEIIAQPKLLAEDTSLLYEDILNYSQKGITSASAGSSIQFSIYYNWKRTELDYKSYKDNYDFANGITSTDDLGYNGTTYLASIAKGMNTDVSPLVRNERMKTVLASPVGANLKTEIEKMTGSIAQNQAVVSQTDIDVLLANQNKVLKDPNGKVFVYSMNRLISKKKEYVMEPYTSGSLWTAFYKFIQASASVDAYYNNATYDEPGFSCFSSYEAYEITLSFSPEVGYKTTLSSNSTNLLNAPYKMFAIPYDKLYWANYEQEESIGVPFNRITDPMACRAVASQIAQNLVGSGALYDIQLLPYCPLRGYIQDLLFPSGQPEAGPHKGVQFPYDPSNVVYSPIVDNTGEAERTVGFVAFAELDRFSFTVPYSIEVPADAVDFKIEHETSMWRLNSPNYAGSFEFKATSNRGISGFEVNCTYKPYQPYIQVNPQFNETGLYGGDFNDARGLICGGDFSYTTTSDAWKTYQIQNKAYSDLHKLEITNMDETYEIQKEQARTAGIIGAITAGVSGATAGGMAGSFGGPVGATVGAGVGALVGGITSALGASADLEYAERLHNQSKIYAEGRYELSLQNVKALPYSLGKVGNDNINTKKAPFLEYYTATDIEKQALRDKITYNGMTINAIGTIASYQQSTPSFIQGQIIRLEGIAEDYHCASAIANEINKGVYI